MTHDEPSPSHATVIVTGVAGLFFGALLGYVIATQQNLQRQVIVAGAAPPTSASVPAPAPTPALVDERELQTYRDILAREPRNATVAVKLANLLYDAGRYSEAIPYYQQALANGPGGANISTDLGTAFWYSGRPDEALAQYARSLEMSPGHPQTLLNMGIVRLEGKNDAKGAIEAWERLLATVPGYPEAQRVRELMARAQQQLGTTAGAR